MSGFYFETLWDGSSPELKIEGSNFPSYEDVAKFVKSLPSPANYVVVGDDMADYIMLAPMAGTPPYETRGTYRGAGYNGKRVKEG